MNILLICGIIAPLLYISTDILLGLSWGGYSLTSQAISELSAIGAPTSSLWTVMAFIFNPLLIAFGIGVQKTAGSQKTLRITGLLITIWGLLGFVWLLFPMNMRGSIGSFSDTMHLIMSGITVFLIVLFIGFGSVTQKRLFRFYSVLTIFTMLIFGGLVAQQAPQVATNSPTPMMGAFERISVHSSMIWVSVLAIILLRKEKKIN